MAKYLIWLSLFIGLCVLVNGDCSGSSCSSCIKNGACVWCEVSGTSGNSSDSSESTNSTAFCVAGNLMQPSVTCNDYYWLQCTVTNEAMNTPYTYIICLIIIIVVILILIVALVFIIRAIKNRKEATPLSSGKSKRSARPLATVSSYQSEEERRKAEHFEKLKQCAEKASDDPQFGTLRKEEIPRNDDESISDYNTMKSTSSIDTDAIELESRAKRPTRSDTTGKDSALNSLRSLEDLMDEYMKALAPTPAPAATITTRPPIPERSQPSLRGYNEGEDEDDEDEDSESDSDPAKIDHMNIASQSQQDLLRPASNSDDEEY